MKIQMSKETMAEIAGTINEAIVIDKEKKINVNHPDLTLFEIIFPALERLFILGFEVGYDEAESIYT